MLQPFLAVPPSAVPPRTKTAVVRLILTRLITVCLLLAMGYAAINYVTLPTLDITVTSFKANGTVTIKQRTLRFSPLVPLLYSRLGPCPVILPPVTGMGGSKHHGNPSNYAVYHLVFRFFTGQPQSCLVVVPPNGSPDPIAAAFTVWDIPLLPVSP